LGNRRPRELSGGEQQRVALARALVISPSLLLLDEPLSALDRKIRQELQVELKRVHRQTGITTLIVTHDQDEALYLADELLVLDAGVVRQTGSPADVYLNPKDVFVAGFLGASNVWRGTLHYVDESWSLEVDGFRLSVTSQPESGDLDRLQEGRCTVAVRPERVSISRIGGRGAFDNHTIEATIDEIELVGPIARIRMHVSDVQITSLQLSPAVAELQEGMNVRLSISGQDVHVYPSEVGEV
jgi:ABC-type Fe3+/spermidine/putrescine transport system ATPase subunit